MTPEHAAALVARWVRSYTRHVPPPVARRRREELDADLHDHIAHERARGTGEGRIARSIVARMLRGLAADVSWRSRTIARHPTPKDTMNPTTTVARSAVRVLLATTAILLVPLALMQVSEGADWSVPDFIYAAALLGGTGALLEVAARKQGNVVYRAVLVAIGVAAIVLGEMDDAPGLMLFGGLLIAGTVALAFRTAQRSS